MTADPVGATVSSPTHVLCFVSGEYVGTATAQPYGYTQVVGETDDAVTVQYKWVDDGDANAMPTGGAVLVHYRWNGSAVEMLDELPVQVTG